MKISDFSQFLSESVRDSFPLLSFSFIESDYVPLDLSENNLALQQIDVSSSDQLDTYIQNHLQKHHKKVAYGGYLETRNIYKRSGYFNQLNPETERNIHLGIDLWIDANTPIYTPLNGEVHSFKNNTNFGDYGPTIILKHCIKAVEFYTLYGHLSLASIANIKVGQTFKKGSQIATLGDATVNGDYPPHLHFQMIKDLQGNLGDYPGVCSRQELDFYKFNCPNPQLVFKLLVP